MHKKWTFRDFCPKNAIVIEIILKIYYNGFKEKNMTKKRFFLTLLCVLLATSSVFAVTLGSSMSDLTDVAGVMTKGFKLLRVVIIIVSVGFVGIIAFKVIKAEQQQKGKVFFDNLIWIAVVAILNIAMFVAPTFLGMSGDVSVNKDGTAVVYTLSEEERLQNEMNTIKEMHNTSLVDTQGEKH